MTDFALPGSIEPAKSHGPKLDEGYHPVAAIGFLGVLAAALVTLTQPDSDHVFKKHEFLYQAYGRYNAGYGLPELAFGSTGVDAA